MKDRTRRSLPLILVVLAIAVALAVFFVLSGQPKSVDMPADNAPPEHIVAAYMKALDAHDCDTAKALATVDKQESTAWWCKNVGRMMDSTVTGLHAEVPEWSGRSTPDEVVNVRVTFDLGWRPLFSDLSMPDGHTTWGYLVVRSSPTDPWRIAGEGNG